MRFAAGARVPGLPHPRAAAEALRGGRAGDRRDAPRSCATLAPDVVVVDILTLAPALAGELEGVPVATLIPHVDPRCAAGLAAVLARRAAAAHARSARRCGGGCDPLVGRGLELGRVELNETRRRLGLPPLGPRPRRDLAATWRSSRPSRSSSTRGRAEPGDRTSSGRCCGSRRSARSSCRPATSRWCCRAVDRRRTPSTGCCAPRSTGSRACRRPRARDVEPAAADRAPIARRPPTRGSSSGCRYARTMPHCDVVVCHGGHGTRGARAGERLRRRRRARGRRHERERRARGLGRASACGSRGASRRRARAPRGASARSPTPACRAPARELAVWQAPTTRPRGRPSCRAPRRRGGWAVCRRVAYSWTPHPPGAPSPYRASPVRGSSIGRAFDC